MKWKLIVGLALLLIGATSAWSQQTSSALSAEELAKELSNPVTSLWSLQFQFNNARLETGDSNPVSGERAYNSFFQPVLPVKLTKSMNLITRPVIALYNSVPHPTGPSSSERTTRSSSNGASARPITTRP